MAQRDASRGRGYAFLAAHKDEGKPGYQGKPSDSKASADLRRLLQGRGRGSQFARGSPLFPARERGMFLGRGSGAIFGAALAKGRDQAKVGLPARAATLELNENFQPMEAMHVKPTTTSGQSIELDEGLSLSQTGTTSESETVTEELMSFSVSDSGLASSNTDDGTRSILRGASGSQPMRPRLRLKDIQAKMGGKFGGTKGRGVFLGRGMPFSGLGSSLMPAGTKPDGGDVRRVHSPHAVPPIPQVERVYPGEIGGRKERMPLPISLQAASHESLAIGPDRMTMAGASGRGITLKRREPGIPSVIGIQGRKKTEMQTSEFFLRKPGGIPQAGTEIPAMVTQPHVRPIEIVKREVIEYHGSSGVKLPIRVNCVKLKCRYKGVCQYHVSFDPDIDNRNLRFNLLNQHREVIGNTRAFDGSTLYLPRELANVETILVSERPTDGAQIRIQISLTKILHPASHMLIPFYNIILHRVMKMLKMCPVGRNYYDPACAQSIAKYKLHLWPGYVTAIREMEGGLLLNIDTSHKVLRNDTVLCVMQGIYHNNQTDFHNQCIKEFVGSTVLTRYNNNNYRVDDIDWSMTPMSTFTTSRGETISFFDYYKTQYRIEIKDLKQPMLINRPKKSTQRRSRAEKDEDRTIALIPELCFLTGISDKLAGDFTAMKDIGEITRLNPTQRSLQIESFLQRVNSSPEARQEFLKWGLELDTSCVRVDGRQLPPEKVLVGNNHIFQCNEEVDFFRDISRAPVLRAVPIHDWVIVFTSRDSSKARDFVQKLVQVSRAIGMQVKPPKYIELRDDRSDSYRGAISSAINPSLQLVVCIFPTARDDRYNAVKRLCCVEMPVPSQVIISRTLPRDPAMGKFRSVTMKIALQINCKLGGELWALSIPMDGLMVCGIDVFHEGRIGNGKSVAALVSSMNKLMTRWYSRAVVQPPQQEIIDSLKHCFCDTLTKYYETNHKLPERIIIYRDGVGDGQLSVVAEHEVKQLQEALKMFDNIAGGEYVPKMTFVVVSKRINIRYFKEVERMLTNPPPGTVLDHTATRPNLPDFYLVSQHVRQGTVSPTHYIAIYGSSFLKPDHLQRLTYKLTHMYYNWPGTVRVPAPCQYAHKLAYLIGENVRKEPALELCDRLFYL